MLRRLRESAVIEACQSAAFFEDRLPSAPKVRAYLRQPSGTSEGMQDDDKSEVWWLETSR
jgi:hypothetical protein